MGLFMTRATFAGTLLLALHVLSAPLHGQGLATTLYAGGGPETNGMSAAVGLRVELGRTLGVYARGALRGVTNLCATSLPPHCNYPEGDTREYAAGVSYTVGSTGWRSYFAAGGGLVSWQGDSDPFVDLALDVRRTVIGQTSFLFGFHAVVAPSVERKPDGNNAIVSDRRVFFPNVVLGLSMNIL